MFIVINVGFVYYRGDANWLSILVLILKSNTHNRKLDILFAMDQIWICKSVAQFTSTSYSNGLVFHNPLQVYIF